MSDELCISSSHALYKSPFIVSALHCLFALCSCLSGSMNYFQILNANCDLQSMPKSCMGGLNCSSFLGMHGAELLSDSSTNVNSMINRRVSLFYRYPLKAFHHMVCLCTLYSACVVCPGTSELVGQHPPPISISVSENGDCQPENKQGWSGREKIFR